MELNSQKEKFASQADSQILLTMREIAKNEGRQFQSLLDEAMRDFIDKKKGVKPRVNVLENFEASMKEFDELYKNLAK